MNDQKQISLTFSLDQCNVILAGLSELPFKSSAEVISVLRTQVENQLKAEKDDNK